MVTTPSSSPRQRQSPTEAEWIPRVARSDDVRCIGEVMSRGNPVLLGFQDGVYKSPTHYTPSRYTGGIQKVNNRLIRSQEIPRTRSLTLREVGWTGITRPHGGWKSWSGRQTAPRSGDFLARSRCAPSDWNRHRRARPAQGVKRRQRWDRSENGARSGSGPSRSDNRRPFQCRCTEGDRAPVPAFFAVAR
jgi:hypothetical protein